MLINIGGVTIKVILDDQELKKLVDLTRNQPASSSPLLIDDESSEDRELSTTKIDTRQAQHEIELLESRDISLHTIVMVARKMLNIDTTGKKLFSSYTQISEAAESWLTRTIRETYAIIYIHQIEVPKLGSHLAIVGLSAEKQLTILSLHKGEDVKGALKALVARGLRAGNVRLGILGLNKKIEDGFRSVFPKATIGRCWHSISLTAPESLRNKIKDISILTSLKEIKKQMVESKVSKYLELHLPELTAYLEFDQSLWRVLRTMSPLYRLNNSLRSRIRSVANEREAIVLVTWECLRIQYHWRKIPVDAEQLSNLRYIKKHADEAAGVATSATKRTVRRRSAELREDPI